MDEMLHADRVNTNMKPKISIRSAPGQDFIVVSEPAQYVGQWLKRCCTIAWWGPLLRKSAKTRKLSMLKMLMMMITTTTTATTTMKTLLMM